MALLHLRALVVRQETRADGSFGLENQVAGLEPRPTEGQAQDLSQFLDQVNVQGLPDFVREVIEIPLILLRQDHGGDPRANGAEDLLFDPADRQHPAPQRSEEHTSELQSRYVISYAVFCLK